MPSETHDVPILWIILILAAVMGVYIFLGFGVRKLFPTNRWSDLWRRKKNIENRKREIPMTLGEHKPGALFWLDHTKTQLVMKINLPYQLGSKEKVLLVSLVSGNVHDFDGDVVLEHIDGKLGVLRS